MKETYFKDIIEVALKLSKDHFQFFVGELIPIDDEFDENIEKYNHIKIEGEKYISHHKIFKKIIDILKRNKKAQ